jgi:hypothetical protein
MTRRAAFTKSDLARAVRVADELGKVVLWTPQGVAFVESGSIALPSPETERGNSCDEAFGGRS